MKKPSEGLTQNLLQMAINESGATGKKIEEVAGYYQNQIRHLDSTTARRMVMAGIIKAASNYGAREPVNDQMKEMIEIVLTKFSFLSPDEIIEAFRQKAAGEFKVKGAEAYGGVFNAELLGKVLSGYNDNRKKVMAAYLRAKQTTEERAKRRNDRETKKKEFYSNFPEKVRAAMGEINYYQDVPVFWYDTAEELGWINFSKEQKKEYWERAAVEIEKEKKARIEDSVGRQAKSLIEAEYENNAKGKQISISKKMMFFELCLQNPKWDVPVIKFENQ